MGLNIKAYSQARFVIPYPQDGNYDDSVHVAISPGLLKDFPERADGLQPGLYTATEASSTLSISYGGWSEWRAQVATVVLCRPVSPVSVIDMRALAATENRPLGHLLCFTDCYGVLGSLTCARLVHETAGVRSRFESAHPNEIAAPYARLNSLGIFDRVAELLAHAAGDGFVLFC